MVTVGATFSILWELEIWLEGGAFITINYLSCIGQKFYRGAQENTPHSFCVYDLCYIEPLDMGVIFILRKMRQNERI